MKKELTVGTYTMILTESKGRRGYYPDANFMGTGMALCGMKRNKPVAGGSDKLPEVLR